MIKKISFSIFILGCFTSILTGDSEWYSIGLVGAVNFFVFACLFKLVKRTYRAIIGEETTKIISQSKEKQLQEDWDQAIKEINETKGFRGFILGFAYGLPISIFSFISVPLSLVDKSWKYHPRYHDKLFGVLFFIFSLTLSVGIRFGMRELANDAGNISNAGNDINVTSNTDTLNQFTGDEIATQNSNAVENINNSIITSANSTFDSQSGMLYANDGRELAHLTNYCIISDEGKIIARFDPNSNLFYDGFNQPLNVTIDDISFRHIKNIHENTLGEADDIADDIDIINGEILDAKTHAHIGFVTTNTLVHQNSIAFSNIDKPQPENVDMHSDHLVVKDENGALAIRFNSQTGILYGKDGHEIAHLINNHIITADGKTFAKYDPTSNLFYDKYMQPLNVKNMCSKTFE